MTVRTTLLAPVNRLRGMRGTRQDGTGFDIQTVKLDIVERYWAGDRKGDGPLLETVIADVPQRYKIRHVSAREVASSGGRFEMEDLNVGPVTPAYSGGGFSPSQLKPAISKGHEIVFKLSGTVTGDYELIAVHTEKAFSYFMILRRKRTTP